MANRNAKSVQLQIRVTRAQKRLIDAAVAAEQITMSEWLRISIDTAARRTLTLERSEAA